jgi:hypothetical protein
VACLKRLSRIASKSNNPPRPAVRRAAGMVPYAHIQSLGFAGRLIHSSVNIWDDRDRQLASEVGACEVGACEVGVCEVGACEVGACEVGACEVGACEVGVCEVGACEVGACEVGACEVGACEVGACLNGPFDRHPKFDAGAGVCLTFNLGAKLHLTGPPVFHVEFDHGVSHPFLLAVTGASNSTSFMASMSSA